ncbi:MAG: hypothetical protein K8J08_03105 [Thermoanaerobaculia bacterium]|nr:hypothetical protein [Thermoanaerobaculia bacterium]
MEAIRVDVKVVSAPTSLAARSDGEVCATATVHHAADRRVRWVVTGTGVSINAATDGDGETEVCFVVPRRERPAQWEDCQAPENEFDDQFRIFVESLAKTGPREEGDPEKLRPPRTGSSTVSIKRTVEVEPRPPECESVVITSFPGCMEWGATRQLEARGADDVVWSTDSGVINTQGLYRAPGQGSETAIAVHSAAAPDLGDEVFVKLAERCGCHVSLWVTGSETFSNLNLRTQTAVVNKLGQPWIALQGTGARNPLFSLWLGFPIQGRGRIPLYVEPYNYMNLSLADRDYSAFASAVDFGHSPGFIHIDQLGDGWLHAMVEGRLTEKQTGASVRARMKISVAIPPNRCP